ncbi:MAG: LptF/LptG family permease [Candidatus Margulisiibacteriota bacterium]
MKVIDKYIFQEMLGPFMIGVVGFVLVMTVDLLFTMADLIINKGVPFFAVLRLLIFKFPSIMVMTFPVSTLFATAMALGRLSSDSEIISLRTSGISLFRISRPIILIGIFVSLLSFYTNEEIVPPANHIASNIVRQIIYKQPLPQVQENLFFKDPYDRFYYAEKVDTKNKIMENIMVYELTDEEYPRVIMADKATFKGRIWELEKGIIHKFDDNGFVNYEASFDKLDLNIAEDILKFTNQKTDQEMDTSELASAIKTMDRGGSTSAALRTELFMKYSIPLSCFVFALIGIPFSLPSPRSGRTWGMVMTIVCMFTFYVFASVFRSLGRGGIVSPMVAAFTPQISFILLGGLLLFREGRFR